MGHPLMRRCWDLLPRAEEGGLAYGQPLIRPESPRAILSRANRPM